jgi:uncharacterized protein YbbC (DUF1343 family)
MFAWFLALATVSAPPVTLGIDVLLTERPQLIAGKRLGLITHASGVDGALGPTRLRLMQHPGTTLVRLFAPEHGVDGARRAGKRIKDVRDRLTGLPVQSLFGKRRGPSRAALKGIDLLLFDIQDVGSRTYTYTSTMAASMRSAKAAGVPFVVLDRPNPLGGQLFEGPVREERFKSFIGYGPTPVTHGMTVGELARFYNAELGIGCDLHVVPMAGWRRDMVWADTGLRWVPTSPGIPHALHAPSYVATGMFGGVSKNVNEGVGTPQPFELLGASFIDGPVLAKALNASQLAGVRFRAHAWRPYYGRFRGQRLEGVQVHIEDPRTFRPIRAALTLLTTVERLYPGKAIFRDGAPRVWGNTKVLSAVRAGRTAAEIEADWQAELADFAQKRARHLLY